MAPPPAGYRNAQLFLTVFAPFAAGYFLSYLFRTINALISDRLMADVDLSAAQLGMLTSAYFLSAAAAQVPLGIALDRYGPRLVQAACLAVAAVGALLFAVATTFEAMFVARALIGLGVASALMAGLKAIVLWFPKERFALLNGVFVACGAAGAIMASAPIELALSAVSWRVLFIVLAGLTAASALAIYFVAPEKAAGSAGPGQQVGFRVIATRREFWRLAPLSGILIGSAWALQSLWAASWLRDVARLDQPQIVVHLSAMAIALCAGGLGFGVLADKLRRQGFSTDIMLIGISAAVTASVLALGMKLPVPSLLMWSTIGAAGAATVISYSKVAELFPKEITGRANGLLNLMHFGTAFAVQAGVGAIVGLWQKDALGRYPAAAYETAFVALAVLQLIALAWFAKPLLANRNVASQRSFGIAGVAVPERTLLDVVTKRGQHRERGRARGHATPHPISVA